MKKLLFNFLAVFVCIAGLAIHVANAADIDKTYTWKYVLNRNGTVILDNYNCNLTIHTRNTDEAEFRLTVNGSAGSDQDASDLDKYLQDLKFQNSTSSVRFKSSFWKNRNSMNGRTTMEFTNGTEISLTDFRIQAELWIPAGCQFELNSKYSSGSMEDFTGSLVLNLYNDNFTGGKVDGPLEVSDKYSVIELKDIKDLKAELYNSRFTTSNTGDLDIVSKYSKIKALVTGTININGYNDSYNFTKTGDITIVAKYSDLTTEASGKLNIDLYDGSFTTSEAGDAEISSKYADLRLGKGQNVNVTSSYNDNLTATRLISINIESSKYTSYRIDELITFVNEDDGYQDKIIINKTGTEFNGSTINGKYIGITLTLLKETDFRLKANIQYPKLDIDESMLKTRIKVLQGSQLEYEGIKGSEKAGMPVIDIKGYQVSLTLKMI